MSHFRGPVVRINVASQATQSTDGAGESTVPASCSRARTVVGQLPHRFGHALADEELVRRMLEGDMWAKEAFYRRYVESAHRLARRLVDHAQDAEDVLQEAFTHAFRDLETLGRPEAVRAWLMRIVVNRAHRKFRRRRWRRALGLDRSDPAHVELAVDPRADAAIRAELGLVSLVLDRLPLQARSAWWLRHVEGYSLGEAAAACQCSLATVKRRIATVERRLEALRTEGERG